MKTILVTVLIAAAAFGSPVPLLSASPAQAAICDEGASEAMRRPGGFCDYVKNLDSLAGRADGSDCEWIEQTSLPLDFLKMQRGTRVHVAALYKCMTEEEQNSV